MNRSHRNAAVGLALALVFCARMAAAALDVTPVLPVVQVPAGSSVLVEAVIENATGDVVFLGSISADLTEAFAGNNLFDEFEAAAPDSLLPGESWEGPIVRLTLAPDAPISTTHQITVHLTGGVHPYDEEDLAEFTFALNDSAAIAAIPGDLVLNELGILRASPNPTSGTSVIAFVLASAQEVDVQVYDVRGVSVRTLAHGRRGAGPQSVAWDGRNRAGQVVAPGIYFVRLQSADGGRRTKVVRIR